MLIVLIMSQVEEKPNKHPLHGKRLVFDLVLYDSVIQRGIRHGTVLFCKLITLR